jgi:hypothetical protein
VFPKIGSCPVFELTFAKHHIFRIIHKMLGFLPKNA